MFSKFTEEAQKILIMSKKEMQELKHPYVYQRLSEDEKDLEYGDIILSVKYKLKKAKSIDKINEIMKLKNQEIIVELSREGKNYTDRKSVV